MPSDGFFCAVKRARMSSCRISSSVSSGGSRGRSDRKGRRDVAAAREKKMRGVVRLTGIQTDRAGNAHPSYCVFIVSGVFGTTGDQYGGSGHGGFLPAESYFILCTSIRTVHKIMVALSGETCIILDTIKIIYVNKKWLSGRSREWGKRWANYYITNRGYCSGRIRMCTDIRMEPTIYGIRAGI